MADDEEFDEEIEGEDDIELGDDIELDDDIALDDDIELGDDDFGDDAEGSSKDDEPESDEEEAEAEVDAEEEEEDEAEDVDDLDDDEDEGEESLEVLLGRDHEDESDAGETRNSLTKAANPIGEGEFTCRSCFLVKRRAQLADPRKLICLDCA